MPAQYSRLSAYLQCMSSPAIFLSVLLGYFLILLALSWYTSRNSDNESFFIGNRSSNWMLVAFGMIGTSLSGVTFISVPGTVGMMHGDAPVGAAYMQVVIGYFIGYFVIAGILLPLYYKMQVTSIYRYLQTRFGIVAYRTGSLFFLVSRTVGATARLYLVINVVQLFVLNALGIPFYLAALLILLMILLYTYRGGVRTIVYTDTLQTTLMLAGLIICIVYILQHLGMNFTSAFQELHSYGYTSVFNTDPKSSGFFLKQILGGMFITISMTGLDQEMMQKNISVKNLVNARKNMVSFSFILVLVNCLFLMLGGLLYIYMMHQGATLQAGGWMLNGKNISGDDLFPTAALQYMSPMISVLFLIALISALFPSADGALTALTSSFCIDMLGFHSGFRGTEDKKKKIRITVHSSFAILFFICIMIFRYINDKSIIAIILDLASYTYGPLLGLFAFGILTRRHLPQTWRITAVCLLAPLLCYVLSSHAANWFHGYSIGIELLLLNGIITFTGLLAISSEKPGSTRENI